MRAGAGLKRTAIWPWLMTRQRVRIDHIGIAAPSLDEGSAFWRALGLIQAHDDEEVTDQGVTTRFFATDPALATENDGLGPVTGESGRPPAIEILEPTGPDTPIGRFLDSRGPGIQQLAFRVDDLEAMLAHLQAHGVRLIDETPRLGAGGARIAFVHPRSTGGVLVELLERP